MKTLERTRRMNGIMGVMAMASLMCASATAHGAITTYITSSSFAAATAGPTTIDFSALPTSGQSSSLSSPQTLSGVTFTGSLSSNADPFNVYGSGTFLAAVGALDVALPAGTVSAGSNVMMYYGNPSSLTITATSLLGDTAIISENPGTGVGYAGFVAAPGDSIVSIHVTQTSSNNFTAVDNFAFSSTPLATPEPASLSLLGVGVAALVIRRKR